MLQNNTRYRHYSTLKKLTYYFSSLITAKKSKRHFVQFAIKCFDKVSFLAKWFLLGHTITYNKMGKAILQSKLWFTSFLVPKSFFLFVGFLCLTRARQKDIRLYKVAGIFWNLHTIDNRNEVVIKLQLVEIE